MGTYYSLDIRSSLCSPTYSELLQILSSTRGILHKGKVSFPLCEMKDKKAWKNCASFQTILYIIWVLNVPYLTYGIKNINSLHLCLSAHASQAVDIWAYSWLSCNYQLFLHSLSHGNFYYWILHFIYIGNYTQWKWKLLADLNERFEYRLLPVMLMDTRYWLYMISQV